MLVLGPTLHLVKEGPISTSNQITQKKRARERNQKEKRQEKSQKREFRKEEKQARKEISKDGVDPDLVGIFPGPHNIVGRI